MIPLDKTANLVLPLPGKKIVGINGIDASAIINDTTASLDVVPDLTGTTNRVYLLDIFINAVLGSVATISIFCVLNDFAENDYTLFSLGLNAGTDGAPSIIQFNDVFTKKVDLGAVVSSGLLVYNVKVSGYELVLGDI